MKNFFSGFGGRLKNFRNSFQNYPSESSNSQPLYGAKRTPKKRKTNVLRAIIEIKDIRNAKELATFETRYKNSLVEEFYQKYKDDLEVVKSSVNTDRNPFYRLFIRPFDKLRLGRLSKNYGTNNCKTIESYCDIGRRHYDAQAILAARVDVKEVERFLKDKRREILQN